MATDGPVEPDSIPDGGRPVVVSGSTTMTVTASATRELQIETRTITVTCSTGARHTADWTGVPIDSLLEAAEVPPETTHLLVASRDGFRVAVPVRSALGGLLAFYEDGRALVTDHDYDNRFVAPSISGTRDVKGVARIDHRVLEPGADPESLEELFPEGERFTAGRYADGS